MLSIAVPLLVAVLGALVYAFAANPKLAEVGRIALFAGLFWCVYAAVGATLHLPR